MAYLPVYYLPSPVNCKLHNLLHGRPSTHPGPSFIFGALDIGWQKGQYIFLLNQKMLIQF